MPNVINIAKSAGFCYGVRTAVEAAKKLKLANPDKKIYILGALIHNAQVTQELENMGIYTVDELPKSSENSICIIRTHGETPENIEKISESGFEIVDLTCPDVKKVQQKAVKLAREDYYVVIIGKENHPEVIGIKAHVLQVSDKVIVVNSTEELLKNLEQIKNYKKIGVVIQTTQTISLVKDIVAELVSIAKELKIENTICPSTSNRQKETLNLAQISDLVIVAGSKTSANTTHLAQIASSITKTIHIETENELDNYTNLIENSKTVSITAGASTPQCLIEAVAKKINNYTLEKEK